MSWIVELEKGVFLADTEGDPGRTLVRENAKEFSRFGAARIALKNARKHMAFESAKISMCHDDAKTFDPALTAWRRSENAIIDMCAEQCRALAEGEDNPQEYRDGANWCRERILALKHTN